MVKGPSSSPSTASRIFVIAIILLGTAVLASAILSWDWQDPTRSAMFLMLALIASGLKLNIPQTAGTLSANFVFVLLSIMELSLFETLVIGCSGTAVQILVHRHAKQIPVPAAFHIANTAIAASIGYYIYTSPIFGSQTSLLSLLLVASVLYAMNTLPVAFAVAFSEGRNFGWVWRECNFRGFPYYVAGACLAAAFHYSSHLLGGNSPLLLVPVAFLVYWSYDSYLARNQEERSGAQETIALHARTIEALAMAIEAKDQTSHTHLRRLQLYCTEIGKEMGLPPQEMEALRAAALLHDIGKLAVPEHILSKAGRLTREEFDKVKIHPVVGAEILERVNFPYPVASIVRCHHEKWNGLGYPLGLKGKDIPTGARILAVADTLDALISDRPYRAAVQLEEAIARVVAEAGLSFDPRVVNIVESRYKDLEAKLRAIELAERANETASAESRFVGDIIKLQRASRTSSGVSPLTDDNKPAFIDSIAAARQEAQVVLELTQELGSSLKLDETFSVLASGLRRLMNFDTLVVYAIRDGFAVARYGTGELTSAFLSNRVPLGTGLVGGVAASGAPDGNQPLDLELGGTQPGQQRTMESAIAVPLPGVADTRGVLLACCRNRGALGKDHMRILMAIASKLGMVMENALKYEQAAASATTDFLTGLPNSRGLNVQIENELARCRRQKSSLAVLVTDLDGFKDVNDRFGHQEGDLVLKAVALALRQSCREYDYVARMGGDEFVILLPGLGVEDVNAKIGQLSIAVADAAKAAVPEARVGLSAGQARYPEDGDSAQDLLDEADQRMYEVKQMRKQMRSHRAGSRGFEFDWTEANQ
ncbi:MAG: diguanylate cyclase [Acidobacteria bacterium]|nr:diguanylate cyclase [Acidobacteriota bacterium]